MNWRNLYYLSVCLLCMALCVIIQTGLPFMSGQWWLLNFSFAYAMQPFINLAREALARYWPKRTTLDRFHLIDNKKPAG